MSDALPRTRTDLMVVELDGETVIYDESSEEIHHLNTTASLIFSLLDGSRTLEHLVADLAAAFDVPVGEVHPQVEEIVGKFGAARLLEDAAQ